MRSPKVILKEEHRAFLVRRLAIFDSPKEAADALKAEFGLEISPQRAEVYDPNKRAARRLSKKWRDLFKATRKRFLDHLEEIPEANKSVRVRHLTDAALAFKSQQNYLAMAHVLEQIAKEIGKVYSNRHELTGRDGKPIQFQDITQEQVDRELALLFSEADTTEPPPALPSPDAIH